MRSNHFNATLLKKLLIKAIAVIGFVTHKLVRRIASKTAINSCLDKLYFIWPRSYRSSTSSWAMRWKIPSRTHCWKRRWHVWYGGYRWGRSFQGAPVRKIHKMAFRICRESRGRRPLGSFFGVNDTIIGSIRLHCSFVSSILILLHNQDLMSRFFLR
jgi:hypothetical protein